MPKRKRPPRKHPRLSAIPKSLLLTHDTTTAEERFWISLLLLLREQGFSGEVHRRVFIVNQEGVARRPDFWLPKIGLAIEIDGLTRESWRTRQDDLLQRDEFYVSLGARPPLVIQATDVVKPSRVEAVLNSLREIVRSDWVKNFKGANSIHKRICDGRKRYAKKLSGIFSANGTEAPQFLDELRIRGIKEERHFGGTRVILRHKYVKFPKPDLKISTEEELREAINELKNVLSEQQSSLGEKR